MPKKKAEKETVKKDKQINYKIKRRRKGFELENKASQLEFKILTRPSTDFPLANEILKKSIEEIIADNYEEISEPFKLQAQHVFVATSSESDELSANIDNYTSVTNNKNALPYSRCCSRRKTRVFKNFTDWE